MKKYLLSIFTILFSLAASAQGDSSVDTFMKSNRKIYVAVAVIFIILTCIFAFLFSIENRLRRLEQEQKS